MQQNVTTAQLGYAVPPQKNNRTQKSLELRAYDDVKKAGESLELQQGPQLKQRPWSPKQGSSKALSSKGARRKFSTGFEQGFEQDFLQLTVGWGVFPGLAGKWLALLGRQFVMDRVTRIDNSATVWRTDEPLRDQKRKMLISIMRDDAYLEGVVL